MSQNRRAAAAHTLAPKRSLEEILEIGYLAKFLQRNTRGTQDIGLRWSVMVARDHNHQMVRNALEAFVKMLHLKTVEGPLPEGNFKFVYKASFLSIVRKGKQFNYSVQVEYRNADPFWPDSVQAFNVHLIHPNGELVNQVKLTPFLIFRLGPVGDRDSVVRLYEDIVVPWFPPRKWSKILEED